MIKYPSIEQFRNIIRTVKSRHDFQGKNEDNSPIYQHLSDYPKLKFKGTVKLHGTNAGVVMYNNKIEFQSRERVLSLDADNCGFMQRYKEVDLTYLFENIDFKEHIAIFGEWCGGNIQKGVAIGKCEKMFVIFGYLVDGEWQDIYRSINNENIYHIDDFPTFNIEIDFNNPELIQNHLIDLTIAVEEKCPVGAYFGFEGIGEGIVFTSIDFPELKFKSKGEKHSASKVKVIASVNVEEINSLNELVDYCLTENRLNQGLQYLKENSFEVHQKSTGDFLRWIVNDILKEESDTIEASGLEDKKIKALIAQKARQWFFNNI